MMKNVLFSLSVLFLLILPFYQTFIAAILEDEANNDLFFHENAKAVKSVEHKRLCYQEPQLTWCLPQTYDKEVAPWKYRFDKNDSLPFDYHFTFIIREVQEVDDLKQAVKIDMYFIVAWYDPRITINDTMTEIEPAATNIGHHTGEFVPVSFKHLMKLWTPDIEVYGMTGYFSGKILQPMASLKINRKRYARYGIHVTFTMSCHMDFKHYPLDSQECVFRTGSYNHHNQFVNCSSNILFDPNERQRHLQYNVQYTELPTKYRIARYGLTSGKELEWAVCGFGIKLERAKSQIMFQVYLPSTLLVIVSWLSFNVNPSAIPGRMGMLVLAFLVLINIYMSMKSSAPISTGMNAGDVFLVACIAQVFTALLEYNIVLIVYRQKPKGCVSSKGGIKKVSVQPQDDNLSVLDAAAFKIMKEDPSKEIFGCQWNLIDTISAFVFPISFMMFLTIYYNSY